MKSKLQILAVAVLLGGALLVGALLPVATQPAQALSVTPVANLVTSNARQLFEFATTKALAADYNTTPVEISSFAWADFEYVVDQGTSTNTTTVTVQYSNDKSNWIDGPALVSSNSADASDMTRLPLFGQYMRINVNVANTNTVTWSLSALAR